MKWLERMENLCFVHGCDCLVWSTNAQLSPCRCNFSDMEIEMFFAKYDLDGSRTLEVDEVKAMLSDLEGQRRALESK